MDGNYQELLEDVKNDRKSGARVVAQKTIDCLNALTEAKSTAEVSELVAEIERVAAEILKAQPGMAQLTNLFNAIFVTIENETSNDPVVLSRKISGEVKRFDESSEKAVSRVAELGADLISQDSIILIHSNSNTIFEIIKKAHDEGKTFQVVLSESRPMREGRACAAQLSKLGISSLYLIDAAISKGVDRADVILLGADSVSEKNIVNKIGTRAICLLAREAVVPCYAACESSKFMPQKLSPKKEQPREPDEVWDAPPADTTVENYYFDEVNLDLFIGIITEEGILTPEEIGGKISSTKLSKKLLEMLK